MLHLDCGSEWQRQVQRHRLYVVRLWLQSQEDPFKQSLRSHPQLGTPSEHTLLFSQRALPEDYRPGESLGERERESESE